MKSKHLLIGLLALIICFTIISFYFGASYLEMNFFGLVPIGNLLIPFGLISFPFLSMLLFQNKKGFRTLNLISIVLSLLWFPIGFFLSGNVDLNFINDASDSALFKKITYVTIGYIVSSFLISVIVTFRHKKKNVN